MSVLALPLGSSAAAYPGPRHTERVSVTAEGGESNGASGAPSLSSDGTVVAFQSSASNLVPGDTNERLDAFVHDRATGTTELITVAHDGEPANGATLAISLSANGRFVALQSAASNLVPEDDNNSFDIFVGDRETNRIERVSIASNGTQADQSSYAPSISADGRFVAFYSDASNLVPEDTNNAPDVFVHDRESGTTERSSVSTGGVEGVGHSGSLLTGFANGGSYFPSISSDGRYLSFWSSASNLVTDDTNGRSDVFLRDRSAGTTERISIGSEESNGHSYAAAISGDGRYVAFESWASNLVPGDTNRAPDIYLHDRATGDVRRISVSSFGAQGNHYSTGPVMSGNGRYTAFYSVATNLVSDDISESGVFVHDRLTGATERMSIGPNGAPDGGSSNAAISEDGHHVAFESQASNLVPGDENDAQDVFVRGGIGTGIVSLELGRSDNRILVSGSAAFWGTAVAVAEDPADDASPGADQVGAELTNATVVVRPEEESILLRARAVSMPGEGIQDCARLPTFPPANICIEEGTGGGVPAVVYGMRFTIDGRSFEGRATRAGIATSDPGGPHFSLYECDVVCTERAELSGAVGSTGPEALVSIPFATLGLQKETQVSLDNVQVFSAVGATSTGALVDHDLIPVTDVPIPFPRLLLGIGSAEIPENEISYSADADLSNGSFTRSLDISSLAPGDYRLWAKACLRDACAVRHASFSIEGEVLNPTSLALNMERARGKVVVTATLTGTDTKAPIGGAPIHFSVNGVEIGDVPTDPTGSAQITIPRDRFKAQDVLRAVFEGDDRNAPAEAQLRAR